MEASLADAVDPVTVSVVQHRLHAIVEEMGEAMLRTAYSQILNSSRDFSTAICDLDGRLIAQAKQPGGIGSARRVDVAIREARDSQRALEQDARTGEAICKLWALRGQRIEQTGPAATDPA